MTVTGLGGRVPQRPDQFYGPRAPGLVPGARSVVVARRVIIFGSGAGVGLFVYSPTIGAGNLTDSIAAAAGTDPFGNAYVQGVANYNPASDPTRPGNTVQLNSGTVLFGDPLSVDPVTFPSGIGRFHVNTTGQVPITFANSAADDAAGTHSAIWLTGKAISGGPAETINLFGSNGAGTITKSTRVNILGHLIFGSVGAGLPVASGPGAILYPSGDTTGATDAALINGLFAGTFGQAVSWIKLLPGLFYVNATIQLPGNAVLEGASGSQFNPSEIFVPNGANLNAVIASTGWLGSTNTGSQAPIYVHDLVIDANRANQASGAGHGIVSQNFGSTFERLFIQNTRGDSLRLDVFGANGTSAISGTMVENVVTNCKFVNWGGIGFNTTDPPGTAAISDGHLLNCKFSSTGPQAINIGDAAGWYIEGNHTYGVSALRTMYLFNCFNTRVIANYIEAIGTSASAGIYQAIIADNTLSNDGVDIIGNMIQLGPAGNAGSRMDGIAYITGNGATAACTIVGNHIFSRGAVGTINGIVIFNNNAAATTNSVTTGNNLLGTFTTGLNLLPNGGVLNHTAGV